MSQVKHGFDCMCLLITTALKDRSKICPDQKPPEVCGAVGKPVIKSLKVLYFFFCFLGFFFLKKATNKAVS